MSVLVLRRIDADASQRDEFLKSRATCAHNRRTQPEKAVRELAQANKFCPQSADL